MGISIDLLPMIGLGFALHVWTPLLELVIGPFVICIGDLDKLEQDE
jgi:hypothetical protein